MVWHTSRSRANTRPLNGGNLMLTTAQGWRRDSATATLTVPTYPLRTSPGHGVGPCMLLRRGIDYNFEYSCKAVGNTVCTCSVQELYDLSTVQAVQSETEWSSSRHKVRSHDHEHVYPH